MTLTIIRILAFIIIAVVLGIGDIFYQSWEFWAILGCTVIIHLAGLGE